MAQQAAIPVYQRDNGTETFYVPVFAIVIQGRELPKDIVRDVMQVTYHDSINDIDSFEITINNWDAIKRKFKYVGLDDGDLEPNYRKIFDPGQELEVRMGYQQPPFRGRFFWKRERVGQKEEEKLDGISFDTIQGVKSSKVSGEKRCRIEKYYRNGSKLCQ